MTDQRPLMGSGSPRTFALVAAILLGSLGPACQTPNEDRSLASEGGTTVAPGDAGASDVSPARCLLPLDPGTCAGAIRRFRYDSVTRSCDVFTYGGCGGNENSFESLAECEETCQVAPASTACQIDATDPSLPGVRVHVEADRCQVISGKRQLFRYRIDLDAALPYQSPDSHGSCSRCAGYTSDPGSLVDTAVLGLGAARYCECDVGCCPPTTAGLVTLTAGMTSGELDWPGFQWGGPSDTSNPIGPPFPPGQAVVQVLFKVPGVGAVDARLPLAVLASTPSPVAAACQVDSYVYPSGAADVPGPSCSRCQCQAGQLVGCSAELCSSDCPLGTTRGSECAACGPTDACEIVRHACLVTCTPSGDECAQSGLGRFCVNGACRQVCG